MAGKIPTQFIDDLLNRIDVVDVINRRVPLKKAGRDFQARCPFHDEKTPSFTVSQQKQFYHCFGCGAHGSAIGFLMEYENLGFVEAVEELAHAAGLEVPREAGYDQGPDLRPLYDLMEDAARFYRHQLKNHPNAELAIDYLKSRGLSGEIAAAFGIGYAPPGWDNLLTALGKDTSAVSKLLECGLTQEGESKGYDRFRDRIIFPIRDRRGRTIGFGGRIIGDEKPKYLNSPETALFHKGRELYGLYEARKANAKIARLLVVEGYMDVAALAQHGILNAVATLGTATTHDHLELIFRTCPEVVFCFDGDRAGRDAAWKALLTSLPLMRDGREVKFLFLPQGEDPDTQIRKEGADAFNARMEQAQPLSKFLFQQLTDQVQMESIDGRAKLAQLASPLLEKLPSGVFRRMMFQHLEEVVGIRDGHLDKGVQQKDQNRQRSVVSSGKQQRPTPIRMAIALLLDCPHLYTIADSVEKDWQKWDAPGISILKQLLEIIRSQPTLNKAALLERWRDTEHFNHLNKLANYGFDLPGMDQEAELRDALLKLNAQFHKNSRPQPGNLRPSELSDDLLNELKRRYPGTLSQDEQ
ncbi:MAG: DNA primase [Candidatus Thiodiazotropha endolucinida]|uniref:DNA primase n=1 Tax=Candidatus Thiodiazotropha taylori TaxID=2792791 RepID=A0A9E4NHD6_9GAMM|nr:DNA primase [Candidatus Thiodiazotropha taylori]MCW4235378.1 DNA primase [Candidatus Thiodiazotropha endolucinida]